MVLPRRRRSLPLLAGGLISLLLWWSWSAYSGDRKITSTDYSPAGGVALKSDDGSTPRLTPGLSAAAPDVFSSKSAPQLISSLASTPGSHAPAFPISSFIALPTSGSWTAPPRIQHLFPAESEADRAVRLTRLAAVKDAFTKSWTAYKTHAWGKDELAPLTHGQRTTLSGWGATLVDSLDTLWLMGLEAEFEAAVAAVSEIDFRRPAPEGLPLNVFETTIRYLGGLLGAYDVSGGRHAVLLRKAAELGDVLYAAFDTPRHTPVGRWAMRGAGIETASGRALLAELASLGLEFTRLSQLTRDPKYYDAVRRISVALAENQLRTKLPGMWPVTVNARELDFSQDATFSIGAGADSAYEYLPKMALLLRGAGDEAEVYRLALDTIKDYILFKPMTPTNEDILLSGSVKAWRPDYIEPIPQMQHLSCFAGGMIALGAKVFARAGDVDVARKLVKGCIWAYESMPTGIMPEVFHAVRCPDRACRWDEQAWADEMMARNSFDERPADKQLPRAQRVRQKAERLRLPRGMAAMGDRAYRLRPEAIESVFVLYRITGEVAFREAGYRMFASIVNATSTAQAFAGVEDVSVVAGRKVDRMESFWMAETLKYFYLLFSEPAVASLDEYVFNTEAHPLRLAPAG